MTVVVLLAPLLDRWPTATSFAEIVAALDDGGAEVVVPDVARAFLLAGLATHAGAAANPPLVAVTATSADAEALAADAAAFLGPERVAVFPAWETLPHEPLSPRSETVARRLALLHRLARQAAGEAPETPEQAPLALLAVPARAVMQPLAPGLDVIEPVRVARGDQMDLEDLLERLVAAGYERTDMVERRGEVAVRGGLVDFFPPGDDHPVRVEFWGDEVEGIRAFAVASQRSLTELPAALAFPCRELRLTAAERQRARQLAAEFPAAGELRAQVADGLAVEGLESLLPLLFDELRLLPDYLPAGAVLALVDPKRTVDRAEEVRLQAEEAAQASWAAAAEGGRAPVEGAGYRPLAEVLASSSRPVLQIGPFDPDGPSVLRVDAHAIEPYRANVTKVATDTRALAADGYTVLLCTEGAGPAERLRDVLRDEGLPVPLAVEPPAAGAAVGTAALLNGFRLPELKLALLAEGDLYGTRRQTREQARMPVTRRRDPQAGGAVALEELQPGDVVVHAVHGIARYVGMEHRTVAGAERDYLLLAYDQGDRLYLPSEQVQMISRYVGGESPKLSRLGSRDWDRQKARVRRKVREMAAELVRLYSARMASPGHAFGPDTPWQQEGVIEAMAAGTMDVVIGTHRLLSADAKWADLGLVVVDEEHRFGVAHKEHLKQLRTEVDVLTLTATPIPRTMEMAISGIRDMSVMETPPEERHPVLTFVGPYDEATAANAIRREMLREGQTFFVHNRVDTIARVAARVRQLVPDARVGVAHGQMSEEQLERIMIDFWDKAYDVLVCTTIIESGIDIPTANTLVVDRADTLGLAQLYQLRGRVGRSRERAYAYLMYPPERSITESSHQRLAAVATHQDLGSGMAIAMKDLEIRGAGNLLGADQSGHVALVGYDLYMQMLAEAVAEMRGRPIEQPKELKLEVPVDAHLPAGYIPRERLRLEAYRRLGGSTAVDAVAALAAELADRYGPPPPPVRNLLALAGVRAQATAVGLDEVVCFGGRARLAPVRDLPESKRVRLDRLYRGAVWKPAEQTLVVPLPDGGAEPGGVSPLPAWLSELLEGVLG